MQSTDWDPEHSHALREYFAKGMSYGDIADAINARFHTNYSRSATIGRGRRLGLGNPAQPNDRPASPINPYALRFYGSVESHIPQAAGPLRISERAAALNLRCIGIAPRHLSLLDLEADDCRYPYGGDEEGEAITFCGHARQPGTSYCCSHFNLTRGPGTASERAAVPVSLRVVEAA
jgi:GcrA cell cycle regulator